MTLSIIIVSWNVCQLLRECLDSIYEFETDIEFEIIVADNASIDNSVKMLKEFPKVSLIENTENLGFAKAINQGLRLANGRYVLLLNPDTRFLRETVSHMIEIFEKNELVGIMAPALLGNDGVHSFGAGGFFPSPRTVFNTTLFLNRIFSNHMWARGIWLSGSIRDLRELDWVSGACMLMKREVYESIGGLDEKYFLLCEDIDYCYRAKQAGWVTCYAGDIDVWHLEGGSIKQQEDKLFRGNPALVDYLADRYSGFQLAWMLALLKVYRIQKLLKALLKYLTNRSPENQQHYRKIRKYMRIIS